MAARTKSVLFVTYYFLIVFSALLYLFFVNTRTLIITSNYNQSGTFSASLLKIYKNQELERIRSWKQLKNTSFIFSQNNNKVPDLSAFDTNFSNPYWPQTICSGENTKQCSEKFKHVETRYRTSLKHTTVACIIQKNMSTMLQAVMCYLFNEENFLSSGRKLNKEAHEGRFCVYKNEFKNLKGISKKFNITLNTLKTWKYLTIVRDPVDRFLSGFVDKCIRKTRTQSYCNGCQSNITCFVLTEYDRIMNSSYGPKVTKSFEDKHFFPQNWRCSFRSELERYQLIRYSNNPAHTTNFLNSLLSTLRHSNVSESSLSYIKDELISGRTVHVTADSEARSFFEKRLMSSPFLLEYVFRMYYWDYHLFGFPLPTMNRNLGK